jgi:hypothetical protein
MADYEAELPQEHFPEEVLDSPEYTVRDLAAMIMDQLGTDRSSGKTIQQDAGWDGPGGRVRYELNRRDLYPNQTDAPQTRYVLSIFRDFSTKASELYRFSGSDGEVIKCDAKMQSINNDTTPAQREALVLSHLETADIDPNRSEITPRTIKGILDTLEVELRQSRISRLWRALGRCIPWSD